MSNCNNCINCNCNNPNFIDIWNNRRLYQREDESDYDFCSRRYMKRQIRNAHKKGIVVWHSQRSGPVSKMYWLYREAVKEGRINKDGIPIKAVEDYQAILNVEEAMGEIK